nr:hypothetical protein HmN_000885600 [Hymenolepis microstoma]
MMILILLGQSPSRRLSPFVHFYSHRMYPETALGVNPTLGAMATVQPASRDISSRKHTVRKIFFHFHGLSHSSTRATTAYRFVFKHILQVKTCISGASCQTCTHRRNKNVSFYYSTV